VLEIRRTTSLSTSALVTAARSSDTVARIGGDEFVILCEHVDHGPGPLIALARRVGGQLTANVTTDSEQLRVTMSIGITTVTADEDADTLIRQADRAMYTAKQRGPGNYHLWPTIEGAGDSYAP
jgi:diguanylate cyclase (GGDEF)-like protein